jgi:uncharacterized membrane protein YgcG
MMKRVLLIIALLCAVSLVACRKMETAHPLEAPKGSTTTTTTTAGTGNATASNAAGQANVNQANEAANGAESLLLPQPKGFVNDYARVLDDATRTRLEELLNRLKQRAQIEFAVVTVETTGKETIDDYSLALARSWGVGSKPRHDGLLLLLAVRDRRWRIQVSRSLEADLPNDAVGEFGRLMNEPFRAGRYGEGLTRCVEALIARLSKRRAFSLS